MNTDQNFVPAVLPSTLPRALRRASRQDPNHVGVQENDPSVREFFALLKKHWTTIFSSMLAFLVLSLLFCYLTPPLYTATATIEIKGYAPVLSAVTAETLYGNDTRKLEYQKTTIAKLWRPGIADQVLSRDGMDENMKSYFKALEADTFTYVKKSISKAVKALIPALNRKVDMTDVGPDPHYNNSPAMIDSYLSLIDINPVLDTSLVEIDAITRDPKLSRTLANAHAESFIEDLRKERKTSMTDNLKTLEAQSSELSKKLSDAENELTKYASENQLIVSNSDEGTDGLIMKNLVTLSESLADAVAKRMKSESLLAELKAADPTDSTALDDDSIRPLRLELEKTQADYRSMGRKVTNEYPAMQELALRVSSLRKSITDQRTALYKGLQLQVESDRTAEANLLRRLEAEKQRGYEQSKKLVRYNVLRKGAASLRELYEAVLKQVQENQVTAATGASNIVISDYATLPSNPSSPKIKMMVVMFSITGLIVGCLISIIREVLDNKVRNPSDIPSSAQISALGALPPFSLIDHVERQASGNTGVKRVLALIRKDKVKSGTVSPVEPGTIPVQLVAFNAPNASVAEALRTIRAGLLLSSPDDPAKVLMVSSANQGEGKTTIAANLAVSLAQADYKVLLIDADLRQSSLAPLFNLDSRCPGLTECITGQVNPVDVIKHTSINNLDLLCAGSRPPNPSELLGSRRMSHLIDLASEQYDFILLDSAPVLAVSDTLSLSQYVDSVILVARAEKTLKSSIVEASERLRRVKAHITGYVMNDYRDPAFSMADLDYYTYPKMAANG